MGSYTVRSIRVSIYTVHLAMTATHRRSIALTPTHPRALHAIRRRFPSLRHPIMRAIEGKIRNPIVPLNASRLLQPRSKVRGNLSEDSDLALDDLLVLAVRHVSGHIADEAFLGPRVEHLLPQCARGREILRADLGEEGDGVAGEVPVHAVEVHRPLAEADGLDGTDVVRPRSLVEEGHAAVSLEVRHPVVDARRVDGELLVIDTDSVAVSIWIAEQSRLEDRICGRLDAGNHVRRVKGHLLDFREVVFGVLVQCELADFAERELLVRPHVREVEDVDLLLLPEIFGFPGAHGLHLQAPFGEVARLDGVV